MLQKISFATFSLALLVGCIKPNKPIVEVCVLATNSVELPYGNCGKTGQGANTIITQKDIKLLDKSTCFAPPEWKKEKDYIDEMESYSDYLEKNCK